MEFVTIKVSGTAVNPGEHTACFLTRVPNEGEYIRLTKEKEMDGYYFHDVYRVHQVVHTPNGEYAAEILVHKKSVPSGDLAHYHDKPLDIREFMKKLGELLTWHDHMRH